MKLSIVRPLAWTHIVFQLATPLAVAFSPAVIATSEAPRFLNSREGAASYAVRPYILGPGETVETVALAFRLTPQELRRLNQFRTFARGFDHLQPGDELDVPVSPLPEVVWHDGTEGQQMNTLAGLASQTGAALTGGSGVASMARGLATGEATRGVQQWLSRFGTAQVQLDTDEHLSLKNAQVDLLIPVYEHPDRLVFTQGSLHRTDGRTQANLGAGLRAFSDSVMAGGNLFLDYDLSRDHARAGLGLEYGRDYLKLGVNQYLRLTGWKDAPELTDYEARPANGWDIRAQGWLPAYPQLGASLMFEQYYGKEVGLYGRDNRQENPHAITAGLNWTPVPLLTVGAEQRQGQSGAHDTRFSVNFRWQPGMSRHQQISPDAVAGMRTLAGSRYDLVERNNNIVLEYRRKALIHLSAAKQITGYTGEQKSLDVRVEGKYGLSGMNWSAPALLAAGGKIVHHGAADYSVELPAWQEGAQAVNSYTVRGVATDNRGNRSEHSETTVSVQAPEVSGSTSTFTPENSLLSADGRSRQVLTLHLRDGQSDLLDIPAGRVSVKHSGLKSATISEPVRTAAGEYTVTVTAGTEDETVVLTPSADGMTFPEARVVIDRAAPDAALSAFSVSPSSVTADNSATTLLTLMVKDADGKATEGLAGQLSFGIKNSSGSAPATGAVTTGSVTETSAGTYTAALKGTRADVYTVVPQYKGAPVGSLSGTFTLVPDSASYGVTLRADRDNSVADGVEQNRVVAVLKDGWGNAAPAGTEVSWHVTGSAELSSGSSRTDANGEAVVMLTDETWENNGVSQVSATMTAAPEVTQQADIHFRPLYTFEAQPAAQAGYASDAGSCESLVRGNSCAVVTWSLLNNKTGQQETVLRPDYSTDGQGTIVVTDDSGRAVRLNQTKSGTHTLKFTLAGVKAVEWKNTATTYTISPRTESEMTNTQFVYKGSWHWISYSKWSFVRGYVYFIIRDKYANPVTSWPLKGTLTSIRVPPAPGVGRNNTFPEKTDGSGKAQFEVKTANMVLGQTTGDAIGRVEIIFSDDAGNTYSDFYEGVLMIDTAA